MFVDWLLGLVDDTIMLVGSVGLVVAERVLVIPDIFRIQCGCGVARTVSPEL